MQKRRELACIDDASGPISFTPIKYGKLWVGHEWSIDNDDELAELVAHIALGQYRHVELVLAETGFTEAAPASTAFKGAHQLLSVPKGKEPYHRDGWLFQVIAWIVSRIQNQTALIAPPQMQHADKGFDGLHVHIDQETRTVQSVVICEEKATINPRKTVRDQVWKEFKDLESGRRDHLLTANVSTLIGTRSDIDPDQAVQKILWEQARAFCIAITVNDRHSDIHGRKRLFKGYSDIVSGDVSRRRVETLHLNDLRPWMKLIAEKARKAAEKMAKANV